MQWEASDTGEDGFKMTSKAWPEARLLMGLMSMSACVRINETDRQTEMSQWDFFFLSSMFEKGNENRSLITFKVTHNVFGGLWVQTRADERQD